MVQYGDNDNFCSTPNFPGLQLKDNWVTGAVYLITLGYLFLGINIISDIFMEAIEQITSKKLTLNVTDNQGNQVPTKVDFWNPTVANLTLMALGSSAPEILLNVIETYNTLG